MTRYSLGFLLLTNLIFASSYLAAFNVTAYTPEQATTATTPSSTTTSSDGGELVWVQTEKRAIGRNGAGAHLAVDGMGIYVGYGSAIEKRSLIDGSIMWQTELVPEQTISAAGIAFDSSGAYLVGYGVSPLTNQNQTTTTATTTTETTTSDYGWRVEKRRLSDGSPLWSQILTYYGGAWWGNGVAVDLTGVYVFGWDELYGCVEWKIEKRNLNDGSIVWNTTSTPPLPCISSARGQPSSIAVDNSGIYLVGTDLYEDRSEWRIEKRSLVDGSLIWVQTENPGDRSAGFRNNIPRCLAVDDFGVYLVGQAAHLGDELSRVEKRSAVDGSLIWGTTGEPPGIWGVAVDRNGVYAAGDNWMEERSSIDGSLVWSAEENPVDTYVQMECVAVDASGVYFFGYEHGLAGFPNFQDSWWRLEKRTLGIPTTSTSTTSQTSADTLTSTYGTETTVTQTSIVISTMTVRTTVSTVVTSGTTATVHGLQMQVVSNSSVSGLVFDSAKGLLNFTVSGPKGTYGFFHATIAKTLLFGQPIVMIDGVEHPASVTEDTDFWYIHVTYSHTEHQITIGGSNTIPEFPPIPLLAIVFILVMIILRRRTKYLTGGRKSRGNDDFINLYTEWRFCLLENVSQKVGNMLYKRMQLIAGRRGRQRNGLEH